ncbi:MAG: ArsA family ATPase [Bacillaceae bacterium]|nr:ArsA family ATPase [Bacillaceae bacterium]
MHPDLFNRQILFLGGKGGVGKSTASAVLAYQAATRSINTLIVSTDPAHSTMDIWGKKIDDRPRKLFPFLSAMDIDSRREMKRFLGDVRKQLLQVVSTDMAGAVDRHLKMVKHTPGSEEAAIFEKMASILLDYQDDYDLIIFDTAPTGHTLRLLSMPALLEPFVKNLLKQRDRVHQVQQGTRALSDAGGNDDKHEDPIYETLMKRLDKIKRVERLFLDETKTAFVPVTVAEALPVQETVRLVAQLTDQGFPIGGVIVNRLLPDPAGDAFWESRKSMEKKWLQQLQKKLKGRYPLYGIPLLDDDICGIQRVREVVPELI